MSWLRQIPSLSVFSAHTIGKGFPDIVIGYKKKNYLIEIKDGDKPPSARKLTADEIKFHQGWKGQIATIKNEDELAEILGI